MSLSKGVSPQTLQSSLESYSESTNLEKYESAQSILVSLLPTSNESLADPSAGLGGVTGSKFHFIIENGGRFQPFSSEATFYRRERSSRDGSLLKGMNPIRGLELCELYGWKRSILI